MGFFIINSVEPVRFPTTPPETPEENPTAETKLELQIFTAAFPQYHTGASCACTMMPGDTPSTHGWVMGVDPLSIGPPEDIIEGAALRELQRAELKKIIRPPPKKI